MILLKLTKWQTLCFNYIRFTSQTKQVSAGNDRVDDDKKAEKQKLSNKNDCALICKEQHDRMLLKNSILSHIYCLKKKEKNTEILIQVDDTSSFFKESTRYLPHVRLNHRILKRLGYNVHHVPVHEIIKPNGIEEKSKYMFNLLNDNIPQFGREDEWLEPDDRISYEKKFKKNHN